MGEYADYANDELMDADELQQRLADIPYCEMTDFEREFMDDYDGTRFPLVFSHHPPRPRGPGPCPACKSPTVKKTNRATGGEFYGCSNFPECHGSRDG